jgi:DNA-binding MarR family transcriptional regulator
MAASDRNVEQFFELMQRFVRLRPTFVAPEPLAHFKRELDSLRGGEGKPDDRTSVHRLLMTLARADQPPSMGELSAELGVPLSTATRAVDWLVAGAFAERLDDPSDRRTVRIRMTPKGQKIYQAFAEFNRQRIARVLRAFTPAEQAQLLKLMNRLLDSFQAEGPQ